jgi:hypothetical protein
MHIGAAMLMYCWHAVEVLILLLPLLVNEWSVVASSATALRKHVFALNAQYQLRIGH